MITFIRHGESTFNRFGTMTPDCPLSEEGKVQASRLAGVYDLIVCSPLRRARETVQFSGMESREIVISPLCREIGDGNPINYLVTEQPPFMETPAQLETRMQSFLQWLAQRKEPTIAVVTHALFLYHLFRPLNLHPQLFHNCETLVISRGTLLR